MTGNGKCQTRQESFVCALQGIFRTANTQPNMKIHWVAAVCICQIALTFPLSSMFHIVLLTWMGWVFTKELDNTQQEELADLITTERNVHVRNIKDIGSGKVLMPSIASFLGFCYILIEYWWFVEANFHHVFSSFLLGLCNALICAVLLRRDVPRMIVSILFALVPVVWAAKAGYQKYLGYGDILLAAWPTAVFLIFLHWGLWWIHSPKHRPHLFDTLPEDVSGDP